ncbi:MAG: HlyD family efflux transporter periplasmic adaptor subunit [archaeon]|nr:HlyD family efflux transporter periplasmic adaptor subunit [archaeon]
MIIPTDYDSSSHIASRMFHKRAPPHYMKAFIFIVLGAVLLILAWSAVTLHAEEVHIHGTVTVTDATALYSQTNGLITDIYVEEGALVYPGQKLIKFDSSEIDNQIAMLDKRLYNCDDKLEHISRMVGNILSVDILSNPFGTGGTYEEQFRNMYNDFLVLYLSCPVDQRNSVVSSQVQTLESLRNATVDERMTTVENLDKSSSEQKNFIITANTRGIVHFDSIISRGTAIQTGHQIGTISPKDSEKVVVAFVSSAERAKVSAGDKCYFTVDGLSQSQFGSVDGVLSSVSSDATVTEKEMVFRCVISYDKDHMTDSRGFEVTIDTGMTVSAWVIYKETTYLDYFLEKLGFR